jgi:hypothetical protein
MSCGAGNGQPQANWHDDTLGAHGIMLDQFFDLQAAVCKSQHDAEVICILGFI